MKDLCWWRAVSVSHGRYWHLTVLAQAGLRGFSQWEAVTNICFLFMIAIQKKRWKKEPNLPDKICFWPHWLKNNSGEVNSGINIIEVFIGQILNLTALFIACDFPLISVMRKAQVIIHFLREFSKSLFCIISTKVLTPSLIISPSGWWPMNCGHV